MKIMGMRWPLAISWSCKSRPLNPGICTSVMRHDVLLSCSELRNSTAEPNVETL